MTKPSIFSFDDLSDYLEAYISWRKSRDQDFSYRRMATEIGGVSAQALNMIVNGKRSPAPATLNRLGAALGLASHEVEFAKLLLAAEKPVDAAKRSALIATLRAHRDHSRAKTIAFESFAKMSAWHHVAIMEMLDLADFVPDPAWISERLGGRISPDEAASALRQMVDLGLVKQDADLRMRRVESVLVTKDHRADEEVRNYHKSMLAIAADAIDADPVERRMVKGMTLTISVDKIPAAQQAINEFMTKMISLTHVVGGDQTYHLGVQFFSLTADPGE